ncbi:MAG: acyltransferase domain-containing protein, partial [Myxococcales bacterium]|nr:acyltransferase domain-containing protein [Myxococcales bacterium]
MSGAPGERRVDGGAIAIVGIGARFAGARDLQELWKVTVEGKDSFGPVPANRWDFEAFYDPNPRSRDKSYAPTGAFIDDVKSFPAVTLQIPPRRVEVMDPQQRFALEVCLEAVEDSGRKPSEMPHRTGVYMGVTAVEFRTLTAARVSAQLMATGKFGTAPEDLEALGRAVENVLTVRPFSAPGVLSNMIAAAVAQELGLHGPAFTTDAACASGLVAVSAAVDGLRAGHIDAALAGGVYLCLTPEHHIAFSRIGAISKSGVCRPFDTRADGFVQGDGCGVVMLKRHADALRDGDRVYGLIHGVGMNNDGGGTGPMAPVKEGQVEVVRTAWERAMGGGVDPSGLGYVETHGTGTHVGDKIEFDGLCEAIGDRAKRAALGSSKANFGHTMSAAGVLGLIRATLALHHETIPPMAGFESHKEDLEIEKSAFFIPQAAEPWTGPGRLATVSSFGFGGTNVHLVLGAADARDAALAQVELVRMSAPDLDRLKDLAGRTARSLETNPKATVAGVARAWAKRREQATRVGVVAGTVSELAAKLAAFARGEIAEGVVVGTAPAEGEPAPRVAFMYPGQGAQRTGMIAGIKARFPVVAETLAALDGASAGEMALPVQQYLYPELRAAAVDADTATAELTDTQNCQPALLAVGTALTKLLAQVGVKPAVVAGHSVGEFTAAVTAGILSAEDGLRWTARRGAAMAGIAGDTGAMAAIVADRATVESLLVPGAVLANVNHPRQIVVSGASDAVAAVVRAAEAREIKAVPLRVSHGFHSPVFADLDLAAVVDALPMSDGAVPVASCIASAPYMQASAARDVFKRHATSPVLWTDALGQMKAAGADLFVEVSAGGPLVSFARGTFPQLGQSVLPLAGNADDDGGASLLAGLAQLWVRGVALDLEAVTGPAQVVSVPPTVLPREPYWPITEAPTLKVELTAGKAPAAGEAASDKAPAPVDAKADKAPAKAAVVQDDVYNAVMAAVARASAYPRDALRAEMRLRDDLGFDSMMVADLVEDLTKSIPGFAGIPQEVLANQPSILDIIDYARNPTMGGAGGGGNDDAPLKRFGLRWVEAPLPTWGARDLAGGSLLAVGDVPESLVAAFAAQGYARVADGAADLVLYVAPLDEPVPVSAVLAGEATAPDYAADLIAVLDAQAKAGARPDVLVVRRDSDPWSEALSGVCRTVAREWPEVTAKAVRVEYVDAERLIAEYRSFDKSVDVRWSNGTRLVPGTALLPVAEPWMPTPSDVVAITGGTRGIGLALGKKLAEGGTTVLLVGRSPPEPAIDGLANLSWVRADVTDRGAVRRALWGKSVTT